MYLLPAGMMLGAPVSVRNWWLWNQIPVTIGNIISGALLTGVAMYLTYAPKPKLLTAEEKLDLRA
jgi:formate/nitrite transporter FocA (FNT family)